MLWNKLTQLLAHPLSLSLTYSFTQSLTFSLSAWNLVFLDKLTCYRNSPYCRECEGLSPHEPLTSRYPRLEQMSPHPSTQFLFQF